MGFFYCILAQSAKTLIQENEKRIWINLEHRLS